MNFLSLPRNLFIVASAEGNGTGNGAGCASTTGRMGLYVWTTERNARRCLEAWRTNAQVIPIDRDHHAIKWIDERSVYFWLIDRGIRERVLDSGEPVPVDTLCRYDCVVLVGEQVRLAAIESTLLRESVPPELVRAVLAEARAKPTETIRVLLDEVLGRRFTKILKPAIEQILQAPEKDVDPVVTALAGKGPSAELSISGEIPLTVYANVRGLVPPTPCRRCGETTWTYLALSANKTAVKWQCDFCGSKRIVREDEHPTSNSGHDRQPLPRHVQDEVWNRDRGRCVECGSREKLEFDHIVPLSRGGSNTTRNIQLLCEPCNRGKGNRIG